MIIDVSSLGDEVLEFDRALRIQGDGDDAADPIVVNPVRLVGTARAGDRGIVLEARLESSLAVECSRCLEPFSSPLRVTFTLTVVREVPAFPDVEVQLDEDDLDLLEVPEGKVDLVAVAREQIYLNVPLKPICGPDCRGLCATCGGNRNRIECGCPRDEPDPRLAPLLEFKKKMGGN